MPSGYRAWKSNGITAGAHFAAISEGIATRKGMLGFRCLFRPEEIRLQLRWLLYHTAQTAQSRTIRAADIVRLVAMLSDIVLRMQGICE